MKKNDFKYNIMVVGTYSSGSSAVTDLLQEYEGVGVIPGEFDDFRRAGMIGDHIIEKISDDYPCNIKNMKFNMAHYTPQNSNAIYNIKNLVKYFIAKTPLKYINIKGIDKKTSKRLDIYDEVKKNLSSAVSADDKIKISKKWMSKIIDLYAKDKEYALFDQPIFLNSHQHVWPKIFNPFKVIIVFRNPKDQIADLIKNKCIYNDIETPTRGLLDIHGDNRIGAIKYELTTLKARMENANKMQERLGKDKVMIISFEDIVNNYEDTKIKIESFLELDANKHYKKRNIFNPDRSRKNINIYKDYLTAEEQELFY